MICVTWFIRPKLSEQSRLIRLSSLSLFLWHFKSLLKIYYSTATETKIILTLELSLLSNNIHTNENDWTFEVLIGWKLQEPRDLDASLVDYCSHKTITQQ